MANNWMLRKPYLKMAVSKAGVAVGQGKAVEETTAGAIMVSINLFHLHYFNIFVSMSLLLFQNETVDVSGGYGNNQGGWNNSNPWESNQGGWGGNQGGGGGYGGAGNGRGSWGGGGGTGGSQDFGSYGQQSYGGGPTRNQQYSNNRSAPYNMNQGNGGSGGGGGYGGSGGNYGGGQGGRGGRF